MSPELRSVLGTALLSVSVTLGVAAILVGGMQRHPETQTQVDVPEPDEVVRVDRPSPSGPATGLCRDLKNMLEVGVPGDVVMQTLQSSARRGSDLSCLDALPARHDATVRALRLVNAPYL